MNERANEPENERTNEERKHELCRWMHRWLTDYLNEWLQWINEWIIHYILPHWYKKQIIQLYSTMLYNVIHCMNNCTNYKCNDIRSKWKPLAYINTFEYIWYWMILRLLVCAEVVTYFESQPGILGLGLDLPSVDGLLGGAYFCFAHPCSREEQHVNRS